MNNFNRLLYTYRFILNKKILFDYNKRNAQNFVFLKKYVYLQYKKELKIQEIL